MKRKKNNWYENLLMIDKVPVWGDLETGLKKLKVNIGIDKLKLCYTVENDTIIKELETENPEFYSLYDFDLRRIEGKYHSDIYQILVPATNKDNEIETVVFGELRFNLKAAEKEEVTNETEKEKKVWIYIENRILYGENQLSILEFISESLGLRLRNVTEIEIYIDSTKKNIPNLLKRMIRYNGYKVFLNGKEVTDRKTDRSEIGYYHTGNLDKYKYLTLYIFSLKALKNKLDGISICAYDKAAECAENGKKYISEKYNNPVKLYRIEIRAGNEKFKEYVNENKIELEEFIFGDKGFLFATFEWFFEKVIYFKDENNEKISVAEILF